MIKEIINEWEANKSKLRDWFMSNETEAYNEYPKIVEAIFTYVISGYDPEKLHVIDDGSYQGTMIFLIPKETYQPGVSEYLLTDTYYGSCSGCDTLLNIIEEEYSYEEEDKEEMVNELMTLSLHLVQKMRSIEYNPND